MKKLIFIFAFVLSAADTVKDEIIITGDDRATFWRAAMEKLRADNWYDSVSKDLGNKCAAKKKVLFLDSTGEPSCKTQDAPTK